MRFVNLLCLLSIVISAGIVFGQQAPNPDPNSVVAEVNGIKITVEDVMVEMNRLNAQTQQKIAEDPNGKTELLNSVIKRKLLVAEAKTFKIDTLPSVKKAVERSAEDIYAQVILNSIQRQSSQVTDDEVKDWYTKNDTLFDLDYRYHLAQIVFQDKKTAENVLKQLRKGKITWDDAVEKYPGFQNAVSGDGGWIFKNNIVQSASDIIANLKKDEFSDVTPIGSIFYILKIVESEPPRKATFDEVKDRIKQIIANQKAQDASNKYENELFNKAKISIDNSVLNSINFGGNQTRQSASPNQK
ncbi:peptidyl-prolyl cis-trans isomerase [bacterium]|nr:peptidyl-prolyl cis-trans isomerase [bacterium]